MKRGFKSRATQLALDVRDELGLSAYQRLDPRDIAEQYGVPVYTVSRLAGACDPDSIDHITNTASRAFSAALVPHGTARIIIDNDSHDAGRRASSLAHEVAHLLLEHEFRSGPLLQDGCRLHDQEQEDEADWLAGELLLPGVAALRAARAGHTDASIAEEYGISVERARMRMNLSGARKRAAAELSRRR